MTKAHISSALNINAEIYLSTSTSNSANNQIADMATDFTLFPKLPPELRLMVWRYTFPGPRKIETRESIFDPGYNYLITPVIAMSICSESRRESKKYYSVHLKLPSASSTSMYLSSSLTYGLSEHTYATSVEVDHNLDVWIDPNIDFVFLYWGGSGFQALGDDVFKIKHVIVPWTENAWPSKQGCLDLLPRFSQAETVAFCADSSRRRPLRYFAPDLYSEITSKFPDWNMPPIGIYTPAYIWECVPEKRSCVRLAIPEVPTTKECLSPSDIGVFHSPWSPNAWDVPDPGYISSLYTPVSLPFRWGAATF